MNGIKAWYHLWVLGHSIETRKYKTELAIAADGIDARKGWLHKCSCGKTWSQ